MTSEIRNTAWTAQNGTTIALEQLLADTQLSPVKRISIEQLKKRLVNWKDDVQEWERVKYVDITYPPIVLISDSEVDMIVDGHHRIHKAIQLGYKEIDAKLISLDELPAEYEKVFG